MTIMSVYNNYYLLNKRPRDELTHCTSNRLSLAKRFVRVLLYKLPMLLLSDLSFQLLFNIVQLYSF